MLSPWLDVLLASGDPDRVDGVAPMPPADNERDELLCLLAVYDLWSAPLERIGERARWQNHPTIGALKWRLEQRFEGRLDVATAEACDSADPVAAVRALAARDLVPEVYEWLATTADRAEAVRFLAVEGGPDGGFDDLVAVCQLGLRGVAKVVLADNFWDEMGRGDPDGVHTTLHDRLVHAVDMPRLDRHELPIEALQRSALNGLLATNRRLQPEMLGALGLLELQAGPRCRRVVRALERVGAPADAIPFYAVHAQVDPRHGKQWLDSVIAPTIAAMPDWGSAIVRGARWRSFVNRRLFERMPIEIGLDAVAA